MKKKNSFYAVITTCRVFRRSDSGDVDSHAGYGIRKNTYQYVDRRGLYQCGCRVVGRRLCGQWWRRHSGGEIHLGRDSDYWCGDDGFSIGIYRLATDQE